MSLIDQARADMDMILADWPTSMLRYRASLSFDSEGKGIETWGSSLSFTGDPQPLSGREIQAEAGLQHHSEYKVQAKYNVDVVEHDRVVWDGVSYRCSYKKVYPDHQNIFVYRELAQP